MSLQIVNILISIIATIFLSTVSNWLYDLLKSKGIFPDKPTFQKTVIIALGCLFLSVLVALPQVSEQASDLFTKLSNLLQIGAPLWLMLSVTILLLFLLFWLNQRLARLSLYVRKMEQELKDTGRRLELSESRLDHIVRYGYNKPEESIINPK